MSQTSDFLDGQLANRYRVVQQLGRRAGRRTLLAQDCMTQKLVVLKLVLFGNDFEWADLKLFQREAETLQSLSHPAIPQYIDHFDLDTPNGKGFALVQTYIEARSLEDHLKAGRHFSEAELKQLTQSILQILIYLHRCHPPVIHRDIKPSNILLGDRSGHSIGQVYLVDFGSVQTIAAHQGSTITVVGTYGYMPPEQFGGRAVAASDLYSLGATLIYLATGQHPADLPQTDLRLQFESFVHLSSPLVRWLQQMTAPSLDRRFASAEAALAALEHSHSEQIAPSFSQRMGRNLTLHKSDTVIEVERSPQGWRSLWTWMMTWLFLAPFVGVFLHLMLVLGPFGLALAWISGITYGLFFVGATLTSQLGSTHLRIDSSTISQIEKLWGRDWSRVCAPLNHVSRVVYTPRFRLLAIDADGQETRQEVRPCLTIWAGVQKFEWSAGLSEPELEWLAQELSDWLGLPLIRE